MVNSGCVLHSKALCDLYESHGTAVIVKSGRLRWSGHIAWLGRQEMRAELWEGTMRKAAKTDSEVGWWMELAQELVHGGLCN